MINEKMRMSKSTIFNWLRHGAEFLENCQETVKLWLLKPGTTIYCDESWVDTKVTDAKGEVHYKKRYMWVILTYMTNHWEELMSYTKIGSVLIDNNCCERAVRPFTNLRKSFGGFSSEKGAKVAATFLTFVETCKLMSKAPLDFFRGFFDMVVAGRRDYILMTEALLVKPV